MSTPEDAGVQVPELPPPLPPVPLPPPSESGPRRVPDGGATPPQVPSHAVLHRTEASRTYPCERCGGQLVFDIGRQALSCASCGNVQPLLEATGEVLERELRPVVAGLREDGAPDARALAGEEKEVVCQSCGGHTTFTGTLTSTRCPYCATPIQRDDVHAAPSRLAVDGVLPFTVDRAAATEALAQWVNSRWFAPSEFSKYSRTGSFASVYTAYFTYDAQTATDYTGQRGDTYTVTVGSGENRRTETRVRWSWRSGRVRLDFDDLTVFANDGLDRKHVTALEPWPLHQVQPFSAEFLAGHLARTYDHDVDACFVEARGRIEAEIDTAVRRDIGGDQQRVSSKNTLWGEMTYKHLLLPIWLLAVVWNGRTFQVLVNGTTGEVHGERPFSAVKITFFVLFLAVVAGLGYLAYTAYGGGA